MDEKEKNVLINKKVQKLKFLFTESYRVEFPARNSLI